MRSHCPQTPSRRDGNRGKRRPAGARLTALALTLAALPSFVNGQAQQLASEGTESAERRFRRDVVFDVRPAAGEMRVDAHLDEPAWQAAERIPLPIEITPGDNIAAAVETDCRVTFDERNIYLGCVAHDPDPASIRAYVTNRDGIFGNHDRISFLLDPFDDRRRAFVFEVSAVGVQGDLIFDERTGFDESWDAIWASAARITDSGYVIEAAIPFRSLRFPSTGDVQTWRFWINRMRPRSEFVVMRTNTRLRGESCQLCQAHRLRGFTGMDAGLDIELVPTLTARQSASRDATFPAGPLVRGSPDVEVGLDARWSLTSNLALNGTVNPDFSQVEADAVQLEANNAFALRFPEKRPFFLEGADLFGTPLEVVFTRSIADPSGGLKLTGKSGPHAIGALAAIDEVNALLIPGPQGSRSTVVDERVASTVLRYRRDVGANNTLGAIYTGRMSGGAYRNHVAGLDAFLRPARALTWSMQALTSVTRYDPAVAASQAQPEESFAGQAVYSNFQYSGRSWNGGVSGEIRTEGLRADAGFLPQTDARRFNAWGAYSLRGRKGAYTLLQANGGVWHGERMNGELLSEGVWLNLYYEGPSQSRAWLNPERRRQTYRGETHELLVLWLGFDLRPLPWLRIVVNGNTGDEIDFRNAGVGRVIRVSPSFDAQLGRHVELGSRHSLQRLEKNGAEVFTARVDELRGVLNLNARAFVRGTVQYRRTTRNAESNPGLERTLDESLFGQALFSYKVNPLTVAFVGLTDDRAGFDSVDGRASLTPRGRTLFVKLGYAWRP
jgi:hypothetical protein